MPDFDVADLHDWLADHHHQGAVVVVLPDSSEIGLDPDSYATWLADAARACLVASTGPTVFYQTDRMHAGQWQDKAAIIGAVATDLCIPMLWHKVVLRRDPNKTDLHRPTYSHLVAYGPGRPGRRRPDVIDAGGYLWPNGMGVAAADFVASWLQDVGVTSVLNPCCGEGTIVEAAARHGITVSACDIDRRRLDEARRRYVHATYPDTLDIFAPKESA